MICLFLSGLQSVFSQIIQSSMNNGIAVGGLQHGKILRINMNNHLKVPTGGGKTIMVAHVAKIATEALFEKRYLLNGLPERIK
jgi:hypothetical protein